MRVNYYIKKKKGFKTNGTNFKKSDKYKKNSGFFYQISLLPSLNLTNL